MDARSGARAALTGTALVVQGAVAAMDGWLLAMLAAAARADTAPLDPPPGEPLRFAVLVPAHDEERALPRTLAALRVLDYPADRVHVVVVADNCTDRTAALGREAGVTVLERTDLSARGKGHALNWALDRLREVEPDADAIAFVDADCLPSANLLRAADARLRAGAPAIQADYVVGNPDASATSALRYAGFALMNRVRPLGREQLGLSAGLVGTGMAFRRDVVERLRFDTASVTEDAELHLRVLEEGGRVWFAPEAAVVSDMPTTAADSESQQRRWEGGRLDLLRERWRDALPGRGSRATHAAIVDDAVAPQALLAALHLAGGVLSILSGRRALRRLAAACLAAQATYVLGGLVVARAPASVFRALASAPLLIARKVALYAGLVTQGGPAEWERTARPADGD